MPNSDSLERESPTMSFPFCIETEGMPMTETVSLGWEEAADLCDWEGGG